MQFLYSLNNKIRELFHSMQETSNTQNLIQQASKDSDIMNNRSILAHVNQKEMIMIGKTFIILGISWLIHTRILALRKKIVHLNVQLCQIRRQLQGEKHKFKLAQLRYRRILKRCKKRTSQYHRYTLDFKDEVERLQGRVEDLESQIKNLEQEKVETLKELSGCKEKIKSLEECIAFYQSQDVWVQFEFGKIEISRDMFTKKS